MTTEEKLNQAAGTIKEGGTLLPHKKIHDFNTYYKCRTV